MKLPGRYKITIVITPDSAGTVFPGLEQTFTEGDTVLFQVKANAGYAFSDWKGNVVSEDSVIKIIVDKDYTLTAEFKPLAKFYLEDNGVTIGCPLADFGDTGTVNGITYTKRHANEITPDNAGTTCTSGIISMHRLFSDDFYFNADIGSWDISRVVDMSEMFANNTQFNQDIGAWDVGKVVNMSGMFSGATSFNADIGSWDVSNVSDMSGMFNDAASFNQDIGSWDVRNVIYMNGAFSGASSFNQDIGRWDVSKATNMNGMFSNAASFNQDIGQWEVSNVTNMNNSFLMPPPLTRTSANGT